MKVLGIIPARLRSTRLPEKLVRKICDKYILQWVWERARAVKQISRLVIATDHEKIKAIARSFGAEVIMTSSEHRSGTDRIIEVARKYKHPIIVNIQGDEPLIHPRSVDKLITVLRRSKNVPMTTLCYASTDHKVYEDKDIVKVIKDKNGNALYFSRSPIPFFRDNKEISCYKHLGIYAYRRSFLLKIPRLRKSILEEAEKLEQLRVLENGLTIKVVEASQDSLSIDTLEDLNAVEKILERL